ncbi:MAG: flavodoxin [Christensenellaceae bacterium]|nr:flavodoxin [Christensenellaceae bacterium]
MAKYAVVYWSGTGNTQIMAEKIAEAGGDLFTASEFSAEKMDDYDAIAFGCPSMGDEVLEESEFDPMFADCKAKLSGKKIALFGSYGWGDGEWMRNWADECVAAGANMVCDYVICNYEPDDKGLEACEAMGKALA